MENPGTPERAEVLKLRKEMRLLLQDRTRYHKILLDEQDDMALSRAKILGKLRRVQAQLASERLEAEGLREDLDRARAEHEAKVEGWQLDESGYQAKIADLEQEIAKARVELARLALPPPTLAPPVAEVSVAESVPWAMTPDKLAKMGGDL